jgi:hexosaminidase
MKELHSTISSRVAAWLLVLVAGSLANSPAQQIHRRILPAPRQVQYGAERLELKEIVIRLSPAADADDRFSAETLVSCMGTSAHARIVSDDEEAGSRAIVLHRTGLSDPLAAPGEKPGSDSREAYAVHIDSNGAEIRARSSAGIYYGVQTVCQMIEGGAPESLPEANITDWPEMAFRGTMVDMSEGQVLRVAEIKRQIDLMARLKMNQYYFYNETTIALDGLPPAAPGARISKSDVREIVAYARQRHIEVVPCLELYGHLHDLFRREEYSELADFPHGVEFNPENPKVAALLKQWAAEYMELFPGPFVHVGFDETWQLRQAAERGSNSPASYFVQQLQNVSELFTSHGKTVLAWADIMVKFPDIIGQLPPGIIAVPWFYDPGPDPEYKKWLQPLAQRKQPFLVAPGINGWVEIAPDYALTFDNIDTMLAAGRKLSTLGMINTVWSDDLQMLKRPVLPGIAYGAVASWQQGPVDREHFFEDYASLEHTPVVAAKLSDALKKLAASETALQEVLGQETMVALWQSPFLPRLEQAARTHAESLRRSRLQAESAERDLLAAMDAGASESDIEAYLVECRLLDYAGMKVQYTGEIRDAWDALGPKPDKDKLGNDFDNLVVSQLHGKIPDLMEAITELKPQYEKAWLTEFTSYRMAAQLGRWDAEYEYWRRLQANLFRVLEDYDPTRGLPPFSSVLPSN